MGTALVALACGATSASADSPSTNKCPEGVEYCSATISEEGESGFWGRLSSIMFNQKKNVSSYVGRLKDDDLTERDTTNEYYDLATDFYEYGWGSSFHFAARYKGETLMDSVTRHEHFLALKLGLNAGQQVADLGMGVGGPLRTIAKFTGATITGVTINDYQVRRAKKLTQQRESAGMASRMNYARADFTRLVPQVFKPESLDAIYYIESACHISNRTEVFLEGARALKKGGRLFTYEWVMTDRYDPSNATHKEIKAGIEYGNGIEKLVSYNAPLQSLGEAGMKVLEHGDLVDLAEEWYGANNVVWYHDMAQQFAFGSMQQFQLSSFGQETLSRVLWAASKVGLVPKDALDTERMLRHGAINLVKGGKAKIFTPMYYILAEKQ